MQDNFTSVPSAFGTSDNTNITDFPSLPEYTIEAITYLDILKYVNSFISLDISKSSTGWIRYIDGEYTQGTYTVETDYDIDAVGARKEFRKFLKDLFDGYHFEYVFIEKPTGGANFKTNTVLYQLNPLVDDMIDDGILFADNIIREDNNEWKKNLRKVSGYESEIKGEADIKQQIRDCLYLLGYGDKTTKVIKEDTYDAMGIAVGVIYRIKVLQTIKKPKKLKNDITKVWKVEQFSNELDQYDYAQTKNRDEDIVVLDFFNIKRDLKYNFKKYIEETQDDTKIYMINILTCKIGELAIRKKFDLDLEESFLVVWR